MAVIPFVRELSFEYGRVEAVSPLVRRVIAHNPSPFTFTGTGSYIVGHGQVAIIDPGPDDPVHLQALLDATAGETISDILVTHNHADHSPLASPLSKITGARVYGIAPTHHAGRSLDRSGEAHDEAFEPDVEVSLGSRVAGPDWTIVALPTPGHTANHVCYALLEENALFSGDHVMGWATTVVIPPDGDMAQYCNSLRLITSMDFATLWPTHGPPITKPRPFLLAYLLHRLEREAQIAAYIATDPHTVGEIVDALYADVDSRLKGAAAMSVWAHLIALVRAGKARCDDADPQLSSVYWGRET